jgi:hypothetical protein
MEPQFLMRSLRCSLMTEAAVSFRIAHSFD